jgi:hypothetical protein
METQNKAYRGWIGIFVVCSLAAIVFDSCQLQKKWDQIVIDFAPSLCVALLVKAFEEREKASKARINANIADTNKRISSLEDGLIIFSGLNSGATRQFGIRGSFEILGKLKLRAESQNNEPRNSEDIPSSDWPVTIAGVVDWKEGHFYIPKQNDTLYCSYYNGEWQLFTGAGKTGTRVGTLVLV